MKSNLESKRTEVQTIRVTPEIKNDINRRVKLGLLNIADAFEEFYLHKYMFKQHCETEYANAKAKLEFFQERLDTIKKGEERELRLTLEMKDIIYLREVTQTFKKIKDQHAIFCKTSGYDYDKEEFITLKKKYIG